MDYFYNIALTCLNYILDFTLYYKVSIQDSYYFKTFYQYLYPPNNVIHAKVYSGNKCIDITNHFSNLLNKGTIGWKDLLIRDLEYINKDNNFHLDIKYVIENNCYRAIYKNEDNIEFPPYCDEEIDEYNRDNRYKNKVIFAETNSKDITKLIKEYSGPLNDFYNNKINIHACLIKDDNGKYLLVEDDTIRITDSHINELEFNKEDVLKL